MMKKFFEEHKGLAKKISCLALAAIIAGTGLVTYQNSTKTDIPELTVFTDPDDITVAEDDVPLAAGTSTSKKVTKKTSTKKTKMKKVAAKSATTTKKSTKSSNKTKKSASIQVKTNTKVATTVKTSTKKKSNIKTTQTTVVTTVTTTTTQLASAKSVTTTAAKTTSSSSAGTYNVKSIATACDARVLNAFTSMGCTLVVNPSVSYSGCFDASKRTITMKTLDSTVYHELGHFLEFVGGTSAVKQSIASAYASEKSLYTAYNKAYVLQNSSEYFAESFKNYCENPGALKQARPNTYNAIVMALSNVTESRVNTILSVYSAIWK